MGTAWISILTLCALVTYSTCHRWVPISPTLRRSIGSMYAVADRVGGTFYSPKFASRWDKPVPARYYVRFSAVGFSDGVRRQCYGEVRWGFGPVFVRDVYSAGCNPPPPLPYY